MNELIALVPTIAPVLAALLAFVFVSRELKKLFGDQRNLVMREDCQSSVRRIEKQLDSIRNEVAEHKDRLTRLEERTARDSYSGVPQ